MILQYRQLVKLCVFNVTAILIHDTLQTTFPLSLSDAVINEVPWQCASLKHDRLLQLINSVKLLAVVDALLHSPKWVFTRFKSGMLGAHVRLNEGDILTLQLRDSVRAVYA